MFSVDNGNHSLPVKELWVWYDKGKVDPAGSPECAFSSRPPTRQPTIDMVDLTERLPFDNPDGGVWKQGFDISYNAKDFATDPLQVFVVPHSHNDPGWLFTFEEYYNRQTRNIFDNIFKGLREASNRKFIYAEMSFLSLWWKNQNEWTKEEFKKCVYAWERICVMFYIVVCFLFSPFINICTELILAAMANRHAAVCVCVRACIHACECAQPDCVSIVCSVIPVLDAVGVEWVVY